MSAIEIPADVKDFVFQYIDSVEQLEILLLLHARAPKFWSADELSDYLRSNRNSIEKRVSTLADQKLVLQDDSKTTFSFNATDEKLSKTVASLSEAYRVQKYKILEMIFSPMKKSRVFADAFKISSSKEEKGDDNG